MPPPESGPAPAELRAYIINPALSMRLVRAGGDRAWMDESDARFANRCLPLLIANQAGWLVLSGHTFRAVWDGGRGLGNLKVEYRSGTAPYPAASHFGHGILTFSLPFLFRTSPGYNLLVRGPANLPKDGASPLEGMVETDWSAATFTVNWKLTRPHHPVDFEEGEPICMLVPQRRGELESFHPSVRRLDDDPDLAARYREWSQDRARFLVDLKQPGSEAAKQKWQKHYFQGVSDAGAPQPQHQTKLRLRDFAGEPPFPLALALPDAESILRDLLVIEGFADPETCQRLVGVHQRFGARTATGDNGFFLPELRTRDPEAFAIARGLLGRIEGLIAAHFGAEVDCDLALLCGIVPGFRHTLHADNARVVCPRHGGDAEALRRVDCRCADARVEPNHTPWRQYSALLYLSDQHQGGEIVFGDGPNRFGGIYRQQITPRPGLLVLSPSNELYFHHTTPVTAGTRYSMSSWFTRDPAHVSRDWA